MPLTVKKLKEILSSMYDDAIITNEQNQDFILIIPDDGRITLSTTKPIGYCKRTGEYVYPSKVKGYSAFSPALDEDLYKFEYIPFKDIFLYNDWTLIVNDDNKITVKLNDEKQEYRLDKKIINVLQTNEYIYLYHYDNSFTQVKFEDNKFLVIDEFDNEGDFVDTIGNYIFNEK